MLFLQEVAKKKELKNDEEDKKTQRRVKWRKEVQKVSNQRKKK